MKRPLLPCDSEKNIGAARFFAFIIYISGLDAKAYVENPSVIEGRVTQCPFCDRLLAKNGGYGRLIPVGSGSEAGWIYRRYCSTCKVSFSLLLDCILRCQRYGRLFVVAWLWECLSGSTSRSEEAYKRIGIACPAREEGTSWTDQLDDQRTEPGYQRLCQWTQLFSERALVWYPVLIQICIVLGIRLRGVSHRVAEFSKAPRHTYPLVMALGALATLQGHKSLDSVSWKGVLLELVGLLTLRPLSSSHKLRRAIRRRLIYDSLTL